MDMNLYHAGGSLLLVFAVATGRAGAQNDLPRAIGQVPDGHVAIGSALGGDYFVAKTLKDKHDSLVNRAQRLKEQIVMGEIDESRARRELELLRTETQQVLQQIEQSKQLILAAKVHTNQQVTRFELGPGRMLLIRATHARVVGWDQPHVECVLDRTVLSVDVADVQEHFDGIKLVHRHGAADSDVGRTEEAQMDEATKDGNVPGLVHLEIIRQNTQYYAPFRQMQGNEIDVIQIEGLTHDEGNRQITIELKGTVHRSLGSQWRRHARLTVFVPKCQAVGIRGGLEGLDVDGVDGSVLLLGEGDRGYDARYEVKNITGDLRVHAVPLQVADAIQGNASIVRTDYNENASTHHSGDSRTMHAGTTERYVYSHIGGDLECVLTRAELTIDTVGGRVDIRNDFGGTTLGFNPNPKLAHRVVSQSGRIDATLRSVDPSKLTTLGMTQSGIARCRGARREIETKNITSSTSPDGRRRSWIGFVSAGLQFFDLTERLSAAIDGHARPPGVDLISHGGSVEMQFGK